MKDADLNTYIQTQITTIKELISNKDNYKTKKMENIAKASIKNKKGDIKDANE